MESYDAIHIAAYLVETGVFPDQIATHKSASVTSPVHLDVKPAVRKSTLQTTEKPGAASAKLTKADSSFKSIVKTAEAISTMFRGFYRFSLLNGAGVQAFALAIDRTRARSKEAWKIPGPSCNAFAVRLTTTSNCWSS